MTIPYILFPGEIAPFSGTGEEADENLLTHTWEEVPQTFQPHIPEAWKKATGIESFPTTTKKCSTCDAMWFSQKSYWPCGEAKILAKKLMLPRMPGKPEYSN